MFFLDGGFIVAFQFQFDTWAGDDTGLNAAYVKCRDLEFNIFEHTFYVPSYTYGSLYWGAWSTECPLGSAVAAAQILYEPDLGSTSDDTGVNDVYMYCGGF